MKKTTVLLTIATASLLLPSCVPTNGTASTTTPASVPTAHPTDKKNLVISPFKPYNILDVRGMSPGGLAKDPTTAAIDPTTKKAISGTAKTFRIPTPAPKPTEAAAN